MDSSSLSLREQRKGGSSNVLYGEPIFTAEHGGNNYHHAQAAELCLLQWLVRPLRITSSLPATLSKRQQGLE